MELKLKWEEKKRWFCRGNPLWHTYFHSVGGDASHSWRGRLCFTLSIWGGAYGAGFGAGNRQADLLPGHLGALWSAVRLQVFLSGGPLVAQVADLHDVSNDLHGSGDCFFTWRDVILHLLQVRRRSPALFILVPAIVIIYLFVFNDWSGSTCTKAFLPQSSWFPCLHRVWASQCVYLINHQPSRFFWITSTTAPFSKAISSFPWLVYDCTVTYFSSAKSRTKTQANTWKHNPNKTREKDVQHIWHNHPKVI